MGTETALLEIQKDHCDLRGDRFGVLAMTGDQSRLLKVNRYRIQRKNPDRTFIGYFLGYLTECIPQVRVCNRTDNIGLLSA